MKTLMKYLSPYYGRMALGLAIKITGTLAELVLPVLLTHILERVIVRESIGEIVGYGVLMILFAAVACVGNMIANRMAAGVTGKFSERMRRELFDSTLALSAKEQDELTVPSLESRITTDTYNVHNFVNMMQRLGVRAPILLVGGVVITLFMDAALALVMIATIPIIFVTVFSVSRRGVPLYSRVQRSVDGMVRVVREDVVGVRVIKALSKEHYECRRFDEVNERLCRDERRAGVIMSIVNPIMTLVMNLGIAAVVALAAVRVSRGESSAATVIAFMQYFTLISMAIMSLSRMFVTYTKCAASARRISEVIERGSRDALPVLESYEIRDTGTHLELDELAFSYLGVQNNIEGVSVKLRRGESLGIIGATGSGKTTLVSLLLRLYDPDKGGIYISGKPLAAYTRDELSSMIGVALQSGFIYNETIEENIKFGREISDEDLTRAAKIAQAYDFISELEDGFSHLVSTGGTNLSGGQRQRVLIARAVAARPEILILDDSSSALDYKTDAALRAALRDNLGDTTVITVAQRVSSVKDSTVILVLDEGRVIGQGTHEELLESCKEYKEISDSQMGGAFLD